ncbi:PAN domain-containing protein [Acuticoccus sp.]|uniref:PAN domain-containing protein n=1 Tax=Acuticoccus sp. TaxID=1904378 RepID=UPI003B516B77
MRLLFSAALISVASLAHAQVMTMEQDTDRYGSDYRIFALDRSDPTLCRQACADDARCGAYTYGAPPRWGPTAKCWLKQGRPARQAGSEALTSGIKVTIPNPIPWQVTAEWSTNRPGRDYRNVAVSHGNARACQTLCAGEGACVAYTYVPPGVQGREARCWLKSSAPAKRSEAGRVSGVRRSYEDYERTATVESDECGPGWLPLGGTFNGPFRQVCLRHDACYRLKVQDQRWCDQRMVSEMAAICNRQAWYNAPTCRFRAAIYEEAITSTYGAASYRGAPQGNIITVQRKRINDTFSDDEVEYCVTVRNPSAITQEYDLRLYTSDNKLVDTEPDTHEFNVQAGGQARRCVGTNFSPTWSISDLSRTVIIILRADTPDSFRFWNDMAHVAVWTGPGR